MRDRLAIVVITGAMGVEEGIELADAVEIVADRLKAKRDAVIGKGDPDPVSYTHLTLPTICSV